MKNIETAIAACAIIALAQVACTKASTTDTSDGSDSVSFVSESAMSEAGSQAGSSEGASAPGFSLTSGIVSDLQSAERAADSAFNSIPRTSAICTFLGSRSVCTSNVDTIDWGGCTHAGATLTGGWTETWTAGFCADGARPGALTNGTSVTRTTTAAGEVIKLVGGATLTTSTEAHTAYDGTAIGSGIVTTNTAGTRSIVLNGIHRVFKGPLGKTLFDHSLKSTGLSVTGTHALQTRVITGNSTLYHNLAKYTAAHTFSAVTWGSSSCCYPTSGFISSALTGSVSGNVKLEFTATCGSATFTDTSGAMSTVALSQCR